MYSVDLEHLLEEELHERRNEHYEPKAVSTFIVAGVVGNSLEWYDFSIYAMLAPIIGAAFFPCDTPYPSTLYAFGGLAVSWIAMGACLGYLKGTDLCAALSALLGEGSCIPGAGESPSLWRPRL